MTLKEENTRRAFAETLRQKQLDIDDPAAPMRSFWFIYVERALTALKLSKSDVDYQSLMNNY